MPESLALNPGAVALGKITGHMPPCRPALTGERLRDPPWIKMQNFIPLRDFPVPGWSGLDGTPSQGPQQKLRLELGSQSWEHRAR